MSFTVSPGVAVREIDLTTVVTSAAATEGGLAGKFRWGPVNERVLISNEEQLAQRFGTPNKDNYIDFMTASSFLAYTNKIRIVRIGNETDMGSAYDTYSSNLDGDGNPISITVQNESDYDQTAPELIPVGFIAKYAGALGNSIAVSTCDSQEQYDLDITAEGTWAFNSVRTAVSGDPKEITVTGADLTTTTSVYDVLVIDNNRYVIKSISSDGTDTKIKLFRPYAGLDAPSEIRRQWRFANLFGGAPRKKEGTLDVDGNDIGTEGLKSDEFHLVVVDTEGEFAGETNTILESYEALRVDSGQTYDDGSSAYYVDALLRKSGYILAGGQTPLNGMPKSKFVEFMGGVDGNDVFGNDEYVSGYDLFKNAEEVDVPLLMVGDPGPSAIKTNYIIENIAEVRKDTVVFCSPTWASVATVGKETEKTIEFRNELPSTSYAMMDSGWKYMYDKYNDTFRWIPLNGDIAGLAARTDADRDPWFSPAGFVRGTIKNVIKLKSSPEQAGRDDLYNNQINPVTDFPGLGTVLFGDKTLLARPSAFDRINVRRLFIVLEKAIANAAKSSLFEFNDEFTRSQFVALVEPFLREVKGRRGVTDFAVVADETVNTPQIVDTNRFVGQIYVKPNRSINFIRLDFVAVRSGVEFSEVVGQF